MSSVWRCVCVYISVWFVYHYRYEGTNTERRRRRRRQQQHLFGKRFREFKLFSLGYTQLAVFTSFDIRIPVFVVVSVPSFSLSCFSVQFYAIFIAMMRIDIEKNEKENTDCFFFALHVECSLCFDWFTQFRNVTRCLQHFPTNKSSSEWENSTLFHNLNTISLHPVSDETSKSSPLRNLKFSFLFV